MPQPIASGSVALNGSGAGTVRIGPDRYGVTWHITRVVTTMGTTLPATELRLYQNVISAGAQIDSTRTPEGDTSETDITMRSPDTLIGVYSGGTPGAVATLIVWGDITRGRG